jgi:DNA polymerase-4
MRYLVWVELDGFYASVFSESAPLIVVRDRQVLDANPMARHRGVAVGQGERQAKALVDGLIARPWQADRYAELRNAWLDVCTEFTGVIEPEDQHAASLDLSGHPDPLDVAERMVRALTRLGMGHVRYGIAPSKWIAHMAALQQDARWSVDDPAAFLAPLPVLGLLPIASELRERLHFLGYREIGDLAQIPLATLRNQFGDEGMRIRQAALGALFDPVAARYPEGSLRDCFIFDGPVDSSEMIENALDALAKRVGVRLAEGAWQSGKVRLTVEDEEGNRTNVERKFTKPLRCPLTTRAAFRLMVGEATPAQTIRRLQNAGSAIASIQVTLSDLEVSRRQQAALNGFVPEGVRRPPADAAIHYLRTVYGDRAVRWANEVEVPRRVQVLREWKNATGWR